MVEFKRWGHRGIKCGIKIFYRTFSKIIYRISKWYFPVSIFAKCQRCHGYKKFSRFGWKIMENMQNQSLICNNWSNSYVFQGWKFHISDLFHNYVGNIWCLVTKTDFFLAIPEKGQSWFISFTKRFSVRFWARHKLTAEKFYQRSRTFLK